MTKDQEIADPTSCWNKATEHELMFVLLARDPAAPVAIGAWIDERLRLGMDQPYSPKILSARKILEEMVQP